MAVSAVGVAAVVAVPVIVAVAAATCVAVVPAVPAAVAGVLAVALIVAVAGSAPDRGAVAGGPGVVAPVIAETIMGEGGGGGHEGRRGGEDENDRANHGGLREILTFPVNPGAAGTRPFARIRRIRRAQKSTARPPISQSP